MPRKARRARNRGSGRYGEGQRLVDGASFHLADEIRYIQRRAADHDGRVVTIGQLVLFSSETGDAWLIDRDERQRRTVSSRTPNASAIFGLVQPASVSSTARARSASPRSREPARAIRAPRCSLLAVTGDFPAMPHTCELVPTANCKTYPLVNRPEFA